MNDSEISSTFSGALDDARSPWITLGSMLLLSFGLMLAGVLMVDQVKDDEGDATFGSLVSNWSKLQRNVQEKKERVLSVASIANPAKQEEVSEEAPENSANIRWPKLTLTAFSPRKSVAFVNGDAVRVGETVSKATVLEITDRGVVVEFKGVRRLLTVEPVR